MFDFFILKSTTIIDAVKWRQHGLYQGNVGKPCQRLNIRHYVCDLHQLKFIHQVSQRAHGQIILLELRQVTRLAIADQLISHGT